MKLKRISFSIWVKDNCSVRSLICCKTIIGFGSPNKSGSHDWHGAPLGEDEIAAAREFLNWPHAPFEIPADIAGDWNQSEKGQASQSSWNDKFAAYQAAHPELAAEYERRVIKGELPADFAEKADAFIQECAEKGESIASRKASQNAIEAFGKILPELLGGSADLAGSNLTLWSGSKGIQDDAAGNYIFYGVREFGMTAIMNGIALHGGFVPYGATFLMFMEYARNAMRMAALMKVQNIQVYTHDSIGLGEDGPTHQPVEHVASLRAMPNVNVFRPADAVETAEAWELAATATGTPSALCLSRQGLPTLRTDHVIENLTARGAYTLRR